MSIPEQKFISWVRKQLIEVTEEGSVARIELFHAADGDGAERLCQTQLEDDVDAEDLSTELWEAAENDARTRTSGMPQRYVAASYVGESHEVISQYPFILGGTAQAKHLTFGDTHPPTEKGERALVMGAVNRANSLMFEMAQSLADRSSQDLVRERNLRIKLEEKHFDLIQMTEDLLDRKHERELASAREAASQRRHEEIMSLIMKVAPLALNAIAGKAVLGGKEMARDMTVFGVLKDLSQEEVLGVLGSLSEEHREKFMQLYMSYSKDEKSEQEKRHPLLRTQDEPSSEGGGRVH